MGISGFCPAIILTVFVTFVGVIMGYLLYMNRQLNRLNDTVSTQQGVLSTLIMDIKKSSGGIQFGASPEAMKVAKLANEDPQPEDDVSDDEDSSDEDSSDEENEDDSNEIVMNETSEQACELNNMLMSSQFGKILEGVPPDSSGIVYMGGTITMDEIGVDNIKDMMSRLNGSTPQSPKDETTPIQFDMDDAIDIDSEEKYVVTSDLQDVTELETNQVDGNGLESSSSTEMSNMKVAELRTIVTDKIGHVANLSKLKKNELLELLDKK
jgi:hypothetical protein